MNSLYFYEDYVILNPSGTSDMHHGSYNITSFRATSPPTILKVDTHDILNYDKILTRNS